MDQEIALASLEATGQQATAELAVRIVAQDMRIERIRVPANRMEGALILEGRLLRPSHEVFGRWLQAFNEQGYTPMLRRAPGGNPDRVILQLMPGVVARSKPRVWINGLLFLLTVLSTLYVGAGYGTEPGEPFSLMRGVPFAAALLGILATHEFGHYFAAQVHRVAVTLPYFIPMPFGLGTLGAFIQMREPIPDRRKLFDIGVAGPIAGLVVALPLLFWGLSTSPVRSIPSTGPILVEGNSLLYYYAKILVFGKALPNPVTGEDVFLNQIAFAAWIGLLVTALNLLPLGQLDGGHTVFALFGRRARPINVTAMGVLAFLGLASLPPLQQAFPFLVNLGWMGWFIWLLLILLLGGPYHPPTLDDVTELDPKRRWVGYLVILIFVLTFTPTPFRVLG